MGINEKDVGDVFRRNLSYYLDRDKFSRTELARRVDVTITTVSNWLNGEAMPGMRKIQELANVFNISLIDLIGDTSYYTNLDAKRMAEQISTNPDLRLLFDAAKDVASEDLSAVHQILKSMKKKETEGDEE